MTITAEHLRKVLEDHSPVVDQALEQLFPDPQAPMSLDALRELADEDDDLADVLKRILESDDGLPAQLEAFLNARGIELIAKSEQETWDQNVIPFHGNPIEEPEPKDFPLEKLGDFALRASAFRCLINVGGDDKGSGAFISKRLVLTAAHVVEDQIIAQDAAEQAGTEHPNLPKITVKASDGKKFEARIVWSSPVHESERTGALPPQSALETHQDVALLRVGLPAGLSYGYCKLPDPVIDWTGPRLMTLVHYPDGNRRGLTPGRVQRDAPDEIRLRHDIDTLGGSSGGLAFDRDLRFIGIHQGRWNEFRRLVPHSLFATHPKFVDTIKRDEPRRYLWSLEDDIEGQLIIGRHMFFSGLAKMLEEPASQLRGIWVRRLNSKKITGLSFSFEMLKAFLLNRIQPSDIKTSHMCFQIPTDLDELDLIASLAEQVLETSPEDADAGVRPDETSDVATERDRASKLAQAMQNKAAADDATYWLFFESPPDDKLSDRARTQFEHLTELLVARRNIRVILAGFEQFKIAPLRFQQPGEADTAPRPGLLVDPLGNFKDSDIQVTLEAILSDLNNEDNLSPALLKDMIAELTRNLEKVSADAYHFEELGRVVKRIRTRVKARLGLD